jgi:uncharacterized membrane protein YbhN (UPF0104 family)
MWRWLVRALVSGAVVAVLLTLIPAGDVIAALGRVSLTTWTASLAIFFAGHYANALKLRWLIGAPLVPASACVRAQYAGLVANLGLPGLAGGDLVRGAYLAPLAGAGRVTLASVADRLLDTCSLLAIVAVALPLAGVPAALEGAARYAAWWVGLGAAGALGLLAAVLLVRRRPAVARRMDDAWLAVKARRRAMAAAVAVSLVVQPAFVMTNAWLAREVGVTAGLAAWFVAWPASKLIAVLPISLGGIGVREAALVSLLAPYGAESDAVLASGILWQAVLTVSGLVGLVVTQVIRRAPAPTAPAKAPAGHSR